MEICKELKYLDNTVVGLGFFDGVHIGHKELINSLVKTAKENNLKSKMIIQVHDELVVEVLKSELDEVTKLVKVAMELNQPLRVPLKVEVGFGKTWMEK